MFGSAGDAETYLGVLDAVFMVSYAVGLYISGIIGDRFELRKVLALGMCSAAVSVFLFGSVLEWAHYYNKYLYVTVWIFNGLLQSTGWPTVVAVMGNWFGKSSRGLVLGLWSACASVGNIIGALMVSQVLHYGYDFAFLVTSTVLFAGGIINFFGLLNSPTELGLKSPDEIEDPDYQITVSTSQIDTEIEETDHDTDTDPLLEGTDDVRVIPKPSKEEALSFWRALLLPGVLLYAFAYFCLKLVNYSFFFWLPYYLHASFGWSESTADKISIWYDIGGIIGGTIAGVISDCFQKRSIVVVPMLCMAIPSLIWYSNSPSDMTVNAFLMTVTGFFIGGVANLISAAISADLGKQGPVQGNKAALATVTGIVDGTGSVGAALGQVLVPLLQEHTGWHSVFYLFIVMTGLTIFCIVPLFVREVPECYRSIRGCCRKYSYSWYCGFHLTKSKRSAISVNSDPDDDIEVLED
ncbi:sugar phosphate exchanger 3-like isoform X2 [Mercenaria mercenaria]|nr:sugar phosphate exchanger 3-like isoform X2 [Mercenaria mercenaria]